MCTAVAFSLLCTRVVCLEQFESGVWLNRYYVHVCMCVCAGLKDLVTSAFINKHNGNTHKLSSNTCKSKL